MVVATTRRRSRPAAPAGREAARALPDVTAGQATLGLVAIAAFSAVLRILIVRSIHAPTIFNDELGYEKLAESIGRFGRLALFNERGLSYSPLYPAVLAPIYAFGAAAPTAYALIKTVNAVLISLSVFPTYVIARYVLSRRLSLLVVALATAAPLMAYSTYTMSESLAYPVCLVAFWRMIEAVRRPGVRNDLLLMAALLLAAAARTQLVSLVPAALTAIVLAAALAREPKKLSRRLANAVRMHWALFGAFGAALLVAAVGGLAGVGVFSVFGRYANVGRSSLPNVGHFLYVLAQHVAGIDLAVGVVPFVGAIVAAVLFLRSSRRGSAAAFAAVAVSVTVWLLLEVAYDAAVFDNPAADLPRIHERFLIYVVPLFLIALFSTLARVSQASSRVYLAAGACAALLPLVIPFRTVVNKTIIVDTFSLQPFAFSHVASHGRLVALLVATVLALLYVLARRRERELVLLVLVPSVVVSALLLPRMSRSSTLGRSFLPQRTDWVDAAKPRGDVPLIFGTRRAPGLETAYGNQSISRLYYLCRQGTEPAFGEQRVTIDAAGRLRDSAGEIRAPYVVAPAGLGIQGRVVARNRPGGEVLVAPAGGRLTIPPARRAAALRC